MAATPVSYSGSVASHGSEAPSHVLEKYGVTDPKTIALVPLYKAGDDPTNGLPCYWPGCSSKLRSWSAIANHLKKHRIRKKSLTETDLRMKPKEENSAYPTAFNANKRAGQDLRHEKRQAAKTEVGETANLQSVNIYKRAPSQGKEMVEAKTQTLGLPDPKYEWQIYRVWVKCRKDEPPIKPLVCGGIVGHYSNCGPPDAKHFAIQSILNEHLKPGMHPMLLPEQAANVAPTAAAPEAVLQELMPWPNQ